MTNISSMELIAGGLQATKIETSQYTPKITEEKKVVMYGQEVTVKVYSSGSRPSISNKERVETRAAFRANRSESLKEDESGS